MSAPTGRGPHVRPAGQGTGRPGSATAAGWIAIGASVVSGTYLAMHLGALVGGRDASRGGGAYTAALVVAIGWCVVAVVLAVLTLRGSSLAGIGLALSSLVAGSIALTASAYFAAAVLTVVACVATIVLLLTGSAREWLRGAD